MATNHERHAVVLGGSVAGLLAARCVTRWPGTTNGRRSHISSW
jgi:hypothetical protein